MRPLLFEWKFGVAAITAAINNSRLGFLLFPNRRRGQPFKAGALPFPMTLPLQLNVYTVMGSPIANLRCLLRHAASISCAQSRRLHRRGPPNLDIIINPRRCQGRKIIGVPF